jgi:DMSO/TMAO reductase YedYZ molybdopterin-dependent catalytic subunit
MNRVTSPQNRTGTRGQGVAPDRLPPGQHTPRGWPVLHYGRVPGFRPESWDVRVFGATADDAERAWSWLDFRALPTTEVTADFHCVARFSVFDNHWTGVSPRTLLELAPPAPGVEHVMVWAEHGYSANLRLADLMDPRALLVTHRDGEVLSPEHGYPVRLVVPRLYAWKGPKWVRGIEYLREDRRGFWEDRGYHNRADPWREQRYSYQEAPGDGPPLSGPRVRVPERDPAPGL